MKCVICKKEFEGHGHNAEPIRKGRCCEECNNKCVIPERMSIMTQAQMEERGK